MTLRAWLVLTAILTLAAGLRFVDLAAPSLWDDEMHTIAFAQRPLAVMAAQSADKDSNPLGFYLLLHAWMKAGDGDAWRRALSTAFGLAGVAAVFALAFALYNARVGSIAALLAAMQPLWIYCAREVRPQAAATLATTLAMLFFVRLLAAGRKRDAAGLAAALAASLHLHYYAFFTLGALGVAIGGYALAAWRAGRRAVEPALRLSAIAALQQTVGAMLYGNLLAAGALEAWRTRGRALLLAAAACATAVVLFLPFFKIFAFQLLRGQPWRPETSPALGLLKGWLYFAFAATPDRLPDFGLLDGDAAFRPWLLGVLAAAGAPLALALLLGGRDPDRRPARRLLLWLTVGPLALLAVALLAQPLFDPRHLLLLTPPALVLAARGVDRVFARSRAAGALLLLGIATPMLLALRQERDDPRFARQDWRGAARAVCAARRSGDVALAYHEEKAYAFAHYARACALPVQALFDDAVLAMDADRRRARGRARLALLAANAPRLWLVDYHGAVYDPPGEVPQELARLGFAHVRRTAYDRGVKRFAIDLFTRDPRETQAAIEPAIDLRGSYNPTQLLAGWGAPGEHGAWIGPRATARLARRDERFIEAAAYVHRPFYPRPVTVRLTIGGEAVAQRTTDESALVTLCGPLPAATAQPELVEAALEVDPTFIPAEALPTQDREPKGALVQRLGLRLTAPSDCP